jgi:hypothetical protein
MGIASDIATLRDLLNEVEESLLNNEWERIRSLAFEISKLADDIMDAIDEGKYD